MQLIIGRKKEQERLRRIYEAEHPAFLAVYGRRRIGKTYLIKNFFKNKGIFFHLTGIQDGSVEVQLRNFAVELADVFMKGKEIAVPSDWFSAFQLLRKEVEKIPRSVKIIIFFDELPWLSSRRSLFLQALEHLWNRYLSEMSNLILIVCGSAASWMIENVINDKGGLHGRVTAEMRLLPFTLCETEEFLVHRKIHLERKQILELYMCLGGVARYLAYLERGKSVAQLIGELCFSYNAPLISEFHKLYRSLFQNHEEHLEIVKTLGASRSGLTYQELIKNTGFPDGGSLTKKLEELTQSGFIVKIPIFGDGKKNHRYVLVDEYSLFYLAWNVGVSALDLQSRGANFWIKQRNTAAWREWTGHAYECLCLKHVDQIKAALGISSVQTRASKWRWIPSKGSKKQGAEIDLVIDRADQCINLCEIKFYEGQFNMSQHYAEQLVKKRDCFVRETETKNPTFITLITTYGAKHTPAYLSVVDQELTMDALFTTT